MSFATHSSSSVLTCPQHSKESKMRASATSHMTVRVMPLVCTRFKVQFRVYISFQMYSEWSTVHKQRVATLCHTQIFTAFYKTGSLLDVGNYRVWCGVNTYYRLSRYCGSWGGPFTTSCVCCWQTAITVDTKNNWSNHWFRTGDLQILLSFPILWLPDHIYRQFL